MRVYTMDHPIIPFSGTSVGQKTLANVSPWINEKDRIPLLLCMSLYDTPIETFQSYELVDNTYKARYAAWIDKQSRILIVGCRGTSIGTTGGIQDIKDDLVSCFLFFFKSYYPFTQIRDNC